MIAFEALLKSLLWGGRKLETHFHRQLPAGPVGEAWELVELPNAHNVAKPGPYGGKSLGELWRAGVFGGSAKGLFPFMLKWIDAADTLSVQVHPDEEACAKMGRGQPKTEAWYVVQNEPGAVLLMGHHAGLDSATLQQAAANNTLAKWLYEVPAKVGDMFLLRAGTIHAIGRGHLLLEVQQASDTTYRINDWGRLGVDGKPRQLHLAEAGACIHYDRPGAVQATVGRIEGPCFDMSTHQAGSKLAALGLRVFVADHGDVTLRHARGEERLRWGDVVIAEPSDGEVVLEGGSAVLITEPKHRPS